MATIAPEGADDKLDEELLRLLATQSRRLPVPIFLAAVLIAWLASYPNWPTLPVVLWVSAVAIILVVRRWTLGRLPDLATMPLRERLMVAVGFNALNGVAHSCGLLFFPAAEALPLAIASLLLVGLCAGAVATTAGNRPLFLAYALPVMGALVLRWLYTAGAPGPQPFALAVAVILALFGAVLLSLADDAFRLFCDSFAIRLQQVGLNRKLRTALERAEAASSAKTRFLASASHDLRQPIHTLSLFSDALAMQPNLEQATLDISRQIGLAVQSLRTQLDALLDMSKLDAGVVPVNLDSFDLAPLAARVAEQYEPIASAKKLHISFRSDGPAWIRSDAALLSRVLGNLLDNAIKYTLQGSVTLSVSLAGPMVVLAIEDTGVGIAEPEQAHVFDEFYQVANPERDRSKGLGLGLSIVARMASLLQLRLEMVSRPGAGTGFYLVLPIVPELAPAPQCAPGAQLAPAGGHVLVVDDEPGVREGMRMLLERLGMRVSLARNRAEALAVVRADPPAFLLSDYRLPDDSGIKVIAAVRALLPALPALLITGDTSPERLREAHAANIRLLHKPVMPDQLRQALAAMAAHRTAEG